MYYEITEYRPKGVCIYHVKYRERVYNFLVDEERLFNLMNY